VSHRFPFVGLVEAMVVQAFRRTDLPLQRIRKAFEILASQGELDHALASKKLFSDGANVLYDYATDAHDGQLRLLHSRRWRSARLPRGHLRLPGADPLRARPVARPS